MSLPDELRLGPVELVVSDLSRSVAFYESALGLQLRERSADRAALGAGAGDLVVLHEEPGARPAGRHAGLYHFALLSDSREELAHAVLRLAATRTPIEGASDHGVSEAIYLSDPDRNGIELYADRPRQEWPPPDQPDARVGMFTIALDVQGLLSAAEGDPRPLAGPGLKVGHVHLHVNDIAAGLAFHRDVLGFDRMVSLGSAEFLAAGGYHHHLGINTWRGEGIPPAPPSGVAGLRNWTVELPPAALGGIRARVREAGASVDDHGTGFLTRDPSGTAVAFTALEGSPAGS